MNFDVRKVSTHRVSDMPLTLGTDKRAIRITLEEDSVQRWIDEKMISIQKKIDELASDQILHLHFMCRGGFQRSVVIANEIAKRLNEKRDDLHLIVWHLTMEMVFKVKTEMLGVTGK